LPPRCEFEAPSDGDHRRELNRFSSRINCGSGSVTRGRAPLDMATSSVVAAAPSNLRGHRGHEGVGGANFAKRWNNVLERW
jgi:hypothetical protein